MKTIAEEISEKAVEYMENSRSKEFVDEHETIKPFEMLAFWAGAQCMQDLLEEKFKEISKQYENGEMPGIMMKTEIKS